MRPWLRLANCQLCDIFGVGPGIQETFLTAPHRQDRPQRSAACMAIGGRGWRIVCIALRMSSFRVSVGQWLEAVKQTKLYDRLCRLFQMWQQPPTLLAR